ncbi:UDP-3-O-(3-hydroxymyristoyl)glucosamine N-acyltransferase [Mangrovibacterium marinum]|uniref:UDP-3-O-acylglucosamine N-acyltransferase n=1 Tax=Mangrovibacterium marinum TaxID=1639118 RepID=A0A2T5BYK8_9BACT|nr:UDP-3-O-(3-hydroxymyristoyl)glucosamine N-acyltransferase [Mangrovibacterium marinum]PTN07322.1 UDP-3-O-[3-hydroxymyristoyl] glucosamine N-acyltransferase [Mangrovibacterium marinum]
MEFKAITIADFLQGTIEGDENVSVNNVSKIEDGKPGTLAFLANPKYEKYIYDTKASIVLVRNEFKPEKPVKCTLIRVEDPYQSMAALLDLYQQAKPQKFGVEQPAFVDSTATVGNNIYIGAFAYIGVNATVGDGSKIYPQAYIGNNVRIGVNTIIFSGAKIYDDCVIGDNCIIHAGAVIGADGFGFAPTPDGSYKKIAQVGNVIVEDDVEIGANTTIDCSTMGSTIIRKGAKLDNQIQIAHNCEVGENTVMAAMTGVAGSTKIGKNCIVAGHVGIAGHLNIGDRVTLGAMAGITNNVKDGKTLLGSPAMDHDRALKAFVVTRRLPELKTTVEQLQKELKALKAKLNEE